MASQERREVRKESVLDSCFLHTKWGERKRSYTSELEFRQAGRVGSEDL